MEAFFFSFKTKMIQAAENQVVGTNFYMVSMMRETNPGF